MSVLIQLLIVLLAASVCLVSGQCNRTACNNQSSNCNGFAYEICSRVNASTSVTSWFNGDVCYLFGHCLSYSKTDGDMEVRLTGPAPITIFPLYDVIQRAILGAYNAFCRTGTNYRLCCPGSVDWPNQATESTTRLAMSNHSLEVNLKSAYGTASLTVLAIRLTPDRNGPLCTTVSYPVTTTATAASTAASTVAGTGTVATAVAGTGTLATTVAGTMAPTTAGTGNTPGTGASSASTGATSAGTGTMASTRLPAATSGVAAQTSTVATGSMTSSMTPGSMTSSMTPGSMTSSMTPGSMTSSMTPGSMTSSMTTGSMTSKMATGGTTSPVAAATAGRKRRDLASVEERASSNEDADDGTADHILGRERRDVAVPVTLPASTVSDIANSVGGAIQNALTTMNVSATVSVTVSGASSFTTTSPVGKGSVSTFDSASLRLICCALTAVNYIYSAIGRQN